eukprot:TRINITY_DN2083_c0_g1_i8.p2 TRINITY_DN2083_c0_g1~~TRINITY_DN2083_c0_g1_i8.p2  ORF type:complete len:139 (-),score=10.20 TRINITY_DN2083_c0_g1_i8:519-935(-)
MGRVFVQYLDSELVYHCGSCGTHLSAANDLICRSFYCKNGKAYLFENVVNVRYGRNQVRQMTTGRHVVADLFCCSCGINVGWKYLAAEKPDQVYKVNKVILERKRIEKRPSNNNSTVSQQQNRILNRHQNRPQQVINA